MDMEDEGVDLMTSDSMFTFGGLCYNGSMKMIDINGGSGENEFKAWTLFGDPSLQVRNDTPGELAVTNNSTHNIGVANYDVTVASGGSPVQGALVCAINDEVMASGYTDANGEVTLVFDPAPTQPGSFTLTITGQNAIPHIQEIDLSAPNGAYVVFNDVYVNDGASNNNGWLNPAEYAMLDVTVENVGTLNASNVYVYCTTGNQYVTMSDTSEFYGAIAAGATLWDEGAFELTLAANAPAPFDIQFDLTATDGVDTWESSFTITAVPDIVVTLTPSGTPIQIPASGGSFNFNISGLNNSQLNAEADVWTFITLPNTSLFGPIMDVGGVNFTSGTMLDRDRTQLVPAGAPAGNYTYDAYIGDYPDQIWSESHFDFTKTGIDLNGSVHGWENFGESFGELETQILTALPAEFELYDAFPNPFNPETTIAFSLRQASFVTLAVYNINGQKIADLHSGFTASGRHNFLWNASGNASGVYFYHLTAGQYSSVKKLVLMK